MDKTTLALLRRRVTSSFSRTRVAANASTAMKAARLLNELGIRVQLEDSSESSLLFTVLSVHTKDDSQFTNFNKDRYFLAAAALSSFFGAPVRNDSSLKSLVKKVVWHVPGRGEITLLAYGTKAPTIEFIDKQ